MELNSLSTKLNSSNQLVTIIGTGNYGTSLARRLIKFGFNVSFGSRNPEKCFIEQNFNEIDASVQIISIKDAWSYSGSIIIFAIHPDNYEEVVKELIHNDDVKKDDDFKIVVDVSNKIHQTVSNSNAESLQSYLFKYNIKASVVKAFNTISAYSMNCDYSSKGNNNSYGNGETVPIASDNAHASESVKCLADQIGFRGCCIGSLQKARQLEQLNETTFIEWHYPSLFSILFFIFNFTWYSLNSYLTKYKSFNEFLQKFSFLLLLNSSLAITSFHLLAYVYLPGLLASLYQLYNGTKRKAFPKYLDLWLKSRKQLGLWAFLYGTFHVIISLIIVTPYYYPTWFKKITQPELTILRSILPNNQTIVSDVLIKDFKIHGLTLHGEWIILLGTITFLIFCLLAISSINSIGLSFNWSEWNFVQTKCGYICLLFALLHDFAMYSVVLLLNGFKKETNFITFTRGKFYALWIPLFVLILKMVLTFIPPISKRIENIRRGVDYRKKKVSEKI